MRKEIVLLIASLALIGLLVSGVIAESIEIVPEDSSFSIGNWLKHLLKLGEFSIIGRTRECSEHADWTFGVSPGDTFNHDADEFCDSNHGLWNLFTGSSWNPYKEYRDDINIKCSDTNTYQCNIELYCCDHRECSDADDCENWGFGEFSECKTVTCTTWKNGGYKCPGEDEIPYEFSSYKYCTEGEVFTCYYWPGSGTSCVDIDYPISYKSCDDIYYYMNRRLYSSKSICENNIPSGEDVSITSVNVQQTTTPKRVKIVVSWTGGILPYIVEIEELEIYQEGITSTSKTFYHTYPSIGSKEINVCVYDDSEATENDCQTKIFTVSENGEGKGDIRLSKDIVIHKHNYLDDKAKFEITLKNFGTKMETINVEAGFYSSSYATDVAELYSAFPLFATAVPTPNCNPAEEFVKTKKVTLTSGEETELEIEVIPYYAFQTYEKGTSNLDTDPLIFFVGLYKECLGGYINEAGTTGKGVMFDYGEYPTSCTFRILGIGGADVWCGENKIGYCSGSKLVLTDKCNIPLTVDVINGTVPPIVTLESTSLIGAKKIALTKDQISKATSQDLLASSCLSSTECILPTEDKEDYEASCISIAKLREEGTLTQSDSDNFFGNAKTIAKGSTYGAVGGITTCLVLAGIFGAGSAGALALPSLVGCAAVGALYGGVGTQIVLDVIQDDKLLDALHAEDENAVGICVKESKFALGDFLEKAALFKITGDKKTDGAIILVGGLLLFIIIFSRLSGVYGRFEYEI